MTDRVLSEEVVFDDVHEGDGEANGNGDGERGGLEEGVRVDPITTKPEQSH